MKSDFDEIEFVCSLITSNGPSSITAIIKKKLNEKKIIENGYQIHFAQFHLNKNPLLMKHLFIEQQLMCKKFGIECQWNSIFQIEFTEKMEWGRLAHSFIVRSFIHLVISFIKQRQQMPAPNYFSRKEIETAGVVWKKCKKLILNKQAYKLIECLKKCENEGQHWSRARA